MRSTDYLLPRLPFGSAESVILRWLRRPGDAVSIGDPLLVAVNDRVEAVLPAPYTGILKQILAPAGAAIVAGAPVAIIVANKADLAGDLPDANQAAISAPPLSAPAIRISPVARRIANAISVDIHTLQGTGVSGRIVKADLLAALASPASQAQVFAADQFPNSQLQSSIAQPTSPDIYVLTVIDVDLERVALAIAQHGSIFARRRLELSYQGCVALVVVGALPYYPLLNSYWADTLIVARRRVHLAFVNCAGVPIRSVCDAQDLNLPGLARALGSTDGVQSIDDRTFTIVDLGDHAWGDPAVWACGGAAALGIGAVRVRPCVLAGDSDRLALRHMAQLALAYDARVLDQCYADAFLRDIKRRLEQFQV